MIIKYPDTKNKQRILIYTCSYGCMIIGFAIILLMLYNAFADAEKFELINVIEYLVPAIIFFGVAYKSFPKEGREG